MTKRPPLVRFTLFLALQVSLVLILYLGEPSEAGSSFLLGYSAPKIAIIALLAAADLALLGALAGLVGRARWVPRLFTRVGGYLADRSLRQFVIFLLGLTGAVVVAYLFTARLLQTELLEGHPYLAVADQLAPLLTLALAVCVETAAFLAWYFSKFTIPPDYRSKYNFSRLVGLFLARAGIAVLVPATLAVLGLLLARTSFRDVIPNWFFRNKGPEMPFRLWQLAALLAVTLPLVSAIIRQEQHRLVRILVLAGALLVVMPAVLREPVSRIYHSAGLPRDYSRAACQPGTGADFIRAYDDLAAGKRRLSTKPPGYSLPLVWLRDVQRAALGNDLLITSECMRAQRTALSVLAVALPLLTLAVLYRVSGYFLPPETQYLPALVAAFFPNFLTLTGAIDHYYLPLVFLGVLWLAAAAVARRSWILAGLTGVAFYLAVFASFALLPAGALAFGWLGLDYLFRRGERNFWRTVLLGAAMALGAALTGIIFYLAFGYDPLTRWLGALMLHRQIMLIGDGWLSVVWSLSLSALEYGVFIGPPTLLVVCLGLQARMIKPDPAAQPERKAFALLAAGLFGTLLLSGSNNVEVARIWLFLNPLPALVTAFALLEFEPAGRRRLLLGYLAVQLLLAYLYLFGFFTWIS